jgi:putative transposase
MLPLGETVFLTLRLHGTVPAATARELQAELQRAQEAGAEHRRAQKQFFACFDAVLDRAPIGPQYFEDKKMAEVVAGEIMMLEETGFVVHGFAILPNHAHLVLHLPARSGLALAKALDLLHLRTDQLCRRLVRPKLPPEAKFWQAGWLDYVIADEPELGRILVYVQSNATRAGLPPRFQAWPYVSE